MSKVKSVTEYINSAPKPAQRKLKEIRACLRKIAPKAEESIKWGTPAFSYERILFTYAGFRKHIGFYPTPAAIKAFSAELSKYKTGKGSIQFPLNQRLPISLISKIGKFRVQELKEKDARWM